MQTTLLMINAIDGIVQHNISICCKKILCYDKFLMRCLYVVHIKVAKRK